MREVSAPDGTFLGLCSELLLEHGVGHLFTNGAEEESLASLAQLQRCAARTLEGRVRERGPTRLRALRQIHGATVLSIGANASPWSPPWPEGDGLVSEDAEDLLAIRTADCLPLLLADPTGSRVAAVHVGWRGLVAGIVPAAVKHFEAGPLAALGPCIGPARFEIGPEVAERFQSAGLNAALAPPPHLVENAPEMHPARNAPDSHQSRSARTTDRSHADLRAAVRAQLVAAGVDAIDSVAPCTYEDRRFPSHRRDVTHGGQPETGRMHALVQPRLPGACSARGFGL